MSSKKMILIIIALVVLFFIFMNVVLKKIQTVEMPIEVDDEGAVSAKMMAIADRYRAEMDTPFVQDETIEDMGVSVLFVDHLAKEAALVEGKACKAVDYTSLDHAMIACNSYMVQDRKRPTLILNVDVILGDPVERAIVSVYKHTLCTMENLDPQNIQYFETLDEDVQERYYRHRMVESLMDAYIDKENLERFHYDYQQWCDHVGEPYQAIVDYDYYDGLQAYIEVKVKAKLNDSFDLYYYLEGYKNEHGMYTKADEYKLMGLLWCLITEREGGDILWRDNMRSDRYKLLVEDVPLGMVEDGLEYEDYQMCYAAYAKERDAWITQCQRNAEGVESRGLNLTSESYGQTVYLEKGKYIYFDYKARDVEGNVIERDAIMAEVTPYRVKYYLN